MGYRWRWIVPVSYLGVSYPGSYQCVSARKRGMPEPSSVKTAPVKPVTLCPFCSLIHHYLVGETGLVSSGHLNLTRRKALVSHKQGGVVHDPSRAMLDRMGSNPVKRLRLGSKPIY